MNSRAIPKLALWLVAGVLVAGTSGTAATLSACGDAPSCGSLRDQEYQDLLTWQACDPTAEPATQCTIFPGNPKDCTGVFACESMAINPHFRTDFERAVLNAANGSKGCYTCNSPSCLSGSIAYCEPISRRCEVVTAFIGPDASSDSGAPTPTPNPTPTDDSGATDAAPE
ncbi:MAG TPA: hypothetical protein VGI39_23750 [Polyangiaceae bacterium]|jgi:hypothetical protein